jgi:thiol-disulfide isomerase/thioredoxin
VAEPTESAPESEPEATEAATPDEAEEAVATEGSWIDRNSYEADPATYHDAGDVVLFFSASWCPPCRATVENLDADGTPAGLTVVRVDYDNSSELKKKYGVTYQHTFVQVDDSGAQLTKFTGSRSGDEIASNTV